MRQRKTKNTYLSRDIDGDIKKQKKIVMTVLSGNLNYF